MRVAFAWCVVVLAGCGGGGDSPVAPAALASLPVCEDPGPMPQIFNPNVYRNLPCPSTSDIEAIRRDIPITFVDVPWSPIVCGNEPGSMPMTWVEERLYGSIVLMRQLRFSTPLPEKWTHGRDLYDWFRSSIRGIVVDAGDGAYCCSPEKVIHLGLGGWSGVSEWRRTIDSSWLPVLVHEARHADTHVPHTCPTDHAKDARTTDLGAYGVQYFLMMWIAEYSDQPQEIRDWYRYSYKAMRFGFCLECANAR